MHADAWHINSGSLSPAVKVYIGGLAVYQLSTIYAFWSSLLQIQQAPCPHSSPLHWILCMAAVAPATCVSYSKTGSTNHLVPVLHDDATSLGCTWWPTQGPTAGHMTAMWPHDACTSSPIPGCNVSIVCWLRSQGSPWLAAVGCGACRTVVVCP